MINQLLDAVFGCTHRRYSFPITVRTPGRRSPAAAALTGTYVACLECGKEFPYDWNEMKVVHSGPNSRRGMSSFATKHAA